MGTWSKIETDNEWYTATGAITVIEGLKTQLYHCCGNDDLFDNLDGAIGKLQAAADKYKIEISEKYRG